MPATDADAHMLRDLRIEDPTNLWLIHPAARALLPVALRLRISANAISVAGFLFGVLAGAAYLHWADWRFATLGFLLCLCWLICDGSTEWLPGRRAAPVPRDDFSTACAIMAFSSSFRCPWPMLSGRSKRLRSA